MIFMVVVPEDRLIRCHQERDRARFIAEHLFQMIDRQVWRDSGGDDGQGHYEGDFHAANLTEEIKSWAE